MVKKTIEIELKTKQAQENIEELNKSLDASKDYVVDLEKELNDLEKQLDKTPKTQLAAQAALREKIEATKIALKDEKVAILEIKRELDSLEKELDSFDGDVKIDGGDAAKEIKKVGKQVQDLNKEVVEANKKTEKGLKGVENASKATAKGLRGIGTAIKAIGIGLLLEAFNFFKETLGQNQKVLDFFNTTFETMSLAFNDFINFITSNWDKAISPVKNFFSNETVQNIIDIGKYISIEIITRIKNLIQSVGGLGTALFKVFKGDFKGAGEAASAALDNLNDAFRGNVAETMEMEKVLTNVTNKIGEYVTETIKAAKANVELARTAEVNAAINRGLIEEYDRQAEQQRQIRDDEQKTLEERIAANNKLGEILKEQEIAMKANAQAAIDAAQAQYDKLKNDENEIALIEAKNELKAIEAQITGFQSEQLSNANALQRESLELTQSQTEAENARSIENQKAQAELIEGEYLKLLALQDIADKEREIEVKRLEEKRDAYQKGTQAWQDANNELEDFKARADQEDIDRERKLQLAKEQLVSDAIGNLISIVGENSKFGKGLAIVQAIRDTYVGANKALAAAPPPFNFISAAAVVAGGLANVKQILATQDPQTPSIAGARGGGSISGSFSIPSIPPQFNSVGTSGINQLAQTIQQSNKEPIKAYVVSGDVTTAQSLDRNIIKEASI